MSLPLLKKNSQYAGNIFDFFITWKKMIVFLIFRRKTLTFLYIYRKWIARLTFGPSIESWIKLFIISKSFCTSLNSFIISFTSYISYIMAHKLGTQINSSLVLTFRHNRKHGRMWISGEALVLVETTLTLFDSWSMEQDHDWSCSLVFLLRVC